MRILVLITLIEHIDDPAGQSFFLKTQDILRWIEFPPAPKKVVKYDRVTLCCWPCVSERNILRVERRGVRHYAANLLYPKALLEKVMPETPEAMRNNDAVNCFLTARQLFSLAARRRKTEKTNPTVIVMVFMITDAKQFSLSSMWFSIIVSQRYIILCFKLMLLFMDLIFLRARSDFLTSQAAISLVLILAGHIWLLSNIMVWQWHV